LVLVEEQFLLTQDRKIMEILVVLQHLHFQLQWFLLVEVVVVERGKMAVLVDP
tara:strand:- start:402 stop:560 length:159 start_codon:yes stop_codon:yes gene_type:complete